MAAGPVDPGWTDSALLTDLYQFTMLQGYFDRGMDDIAVFEFFVRQLPSQRRFLVAAGLQQVLEYLESLHFTGEELAALDATGLFAADFLDYLRGFRFTGEVHAMPEGSVFFAGEPILQVTAPLPEAQFVESRLMNILHLQTLIASKAARCVLAGDGRTLLDFGMRRAHGAEAALYAARASYLAGFAGTATVLAESAFGIPIFGTMAHSFIQAHGSEREAFEHFARSHRGAVVLLIDTYDIDAAAREVVALSRKLAEDGIRVNSVRIDSGDLLQESRHVRAILDAGDCEGVEIFVSGGLEEQQIARLVADGAPINGFGIGTALNVSADVPALDCVYKLQEYAGEPRRKRSAGKQTLPGRKQVFRQFDISGRMSGDLIALATEQVAAGKPAADQTTTDQTAGQQMPGEQIDGVPLLERVMRDGQRLVPEDGLVAGRNRAARALDQLPDTLRSLIEQKAQPAYPVAVSAALEALALQADAAIDPGMARR